MIDLKLKEKLLEKIKANRHLIDSLIKDNCKIEDEIHEGIKDEDPQLDEYDFWLCPYCKERALNGCPGFNNGGEVHATCKNNHAFYFDINEIGDLKYIAKIQRYENGVEYFVYKKSCYNMIRPDVLSKMSEDV